MQIRLQTSSGDLCIVHPKCSETMRSILCSAFGSADNYSTCVLNGNIIPLDLSIASQGVKENDTIYVVSRRQKVKKAKRWERDAVERYERTLFEEALRVSDVSFMILESSKGANLMYRSLMEEDSEDEEYRSQTIVENSQAISDQPLPVCWNDYEHDVYGQFVLKFCHPQRDTFVARELMKEGDCL